ncbi:TrkA family potassium uptake protein [Faecalicatena contorta]|uniref:potassium channel family protein n=1 Tax=Faecalicatena contorta TaxID=39482 RepID=UPI00195FBCD6|nr:TrkA family potassium uptake protein [Faecalicatena contorta]MBM6684738.1 TrkA family potassium uptake protein [Faecalicatena contorta]MBM6709718.1 TrkA family potassium uptake protein [Faecalicatena contorta]
MKKRAKLTYGIIGLGRFGMALALTLAESNNDVIVMDREESSIREMRNYTDYAFVTNDLSMESLREAGIHNCDVVIVCIGEKVDVSVLTTMSVIEMGVPRVIAKALSPEQGAVLKKLGAEVVYPERDMALRLGRKLLSGNFLDYVSLDHSVEIRQIQISERMEGKTVQQIQIRQKYGLNIIAIESGSDTNIEIQPDYRLKKEDIIVVIGKVNNINTFEESL